MRQYRKASHCAYDLKYHIVWITKYRKPVLSREIGTRVRDLVRMICASLDVEIVKGSVSRDHVHLLVSAPPTLSVSRLVQRIKGLTSRKLLMENRGLNKVYWGEASVGSRLLRGQHRERDRGNDRSLHRESTGDERPRRCRLQSRTVMSAPVGFSRRAQNPPTLVGGGLAIQ